MEGGNTYNKLIPRTEQDRKTTRLIVLLNQTGKATHESTGVVVETKPMAISKNFVNNYWYFNLLSDLRNTQELQIETYDGKTINKVDFPQSMLKRFRDYLVKRNEITSKFDCADFAHALNGVAYEHADYKPEKWDRSNFDGNLKPGDTIAMTTTNNPTVADYKHFAIYLDKGMYLSKHGNIGPLIVTDLDGMKKLFRAETVFKITPKKESVTLP